MTTRQIFQILGGQKTLRRNIRGVSDFIAIVREGLPASAVSFLLSESHITQDEAIQALQIPKRTFTRRMRSAHFDPVESEKLVRLARVIAFAREVFEGDLNKSSEWLRRPNRALGNERPISLLDSDLGAEQVTDLLGRLQEGVYG